MESLVGKDEVFIVEKLHCMLRNEEKVKVQEDIIRNLETEIEDNKGEINYLKNKLDNKYDVIEDLEHDIDQLEGQLKEKDDLLQYQKNVMQNKDRMISQLNEMREESEEKCSKLEQKLQDEMKQKREYLDLQEEIKNLIEEIKHLKFTNGKKEDEIENISKENKNLKAQVETIKESKRKEESVSLEDELGPYLKKNFKCKECDEMFGNLSYLKHHKKTHHGVDNQILLMQLRLLEISKQISDQKLDITHKISNLREKEFSESQTCKCQGWCAINHTKHSWQVTKSESVFTMVQRMGLKLVV